MVLHVRTHEHYPMDFVRYAGGMEAGAAAADVLFGATNPSGTLAAAVYKASWTNASNFLDMGMRTPPGRTHRYLEASALEEHILYPFGTYVA